MFTLVSSLFQESLGEENELIKSDGSSHCDYLFNTVAILVPDKFVRLSFFC